MDKLIYKLPEFELSYETISHRKVSPLYNICLAIPVGKKAFAWFTTTESGDNICVMYELNKEKRIVKTEQLKVEFDAELSLGTILYVTCIFDESRNIQFFVIEDIFYFKATSLRRSIMHEKLLVLEDLMASIDRTNNNFVFMLPAIWKFVASGTEYPAVVPSQFSGQIAYNVHHIQYRSTAEIMPFLNVFINNNNSIKKTMAAGGGGTVPTVAPDPRFTQFNMDFSKPQYKYATIFQVSADIQYDIYHLYAYGKHKSLVYYNVAYVPNYKSSVYLNGLFRNIRENRNLDYIEESDDEDDFQNTKEDKYVDVEKTLLMECIFHNKFKKWIPIRVMGTHSKVVHINSLVNYYR